MATTLPDGRVLNHLSYGSGHVHQINLDGQVVCDIERDALHRETSRSQGSLHSHYQRDAMGRLLWSRAQQSSVLATAGQPAEPQSTQQVRVYSCCFCYDHAQKMHSADYTSIWRAMGVARCIHLPMLGHEIKTAVQTRGL